MPAVPVPSHAKVIHDLRVRRVLVRFLQVAPPRVGLLAACGGGAATCGTTTVAAGPPAGRVGLICGRHACSRGVKSVGWVKRSPGLGLSGDGGC